MENQPTQPETSPGVEPQRVAAEAQRKHAEDQREDADVERAGQEDVRQGNEDERIDAEAAGNWRSGCAKRPRRSGRSPNASVRQWRNSSCWGSRAVRLPSSGVLPNTNSAP